MANKDGNGNWKEYVKVEQRWVDNRVVIKPLYIPMFPQWRLGWTTIRWFTYTIFSSH